MRYFLLYPNAAFSGLLKLEVIGACDVIANDYANQHNADIAQNTNVTL